LNLYLNLLDQQVKMEDENEILTQHAAQVRGLAKEYKTGLADSYSVFIKFLNDGGNIDDVMSWVNHPNEKGHQMVAKEIIKWF